MKKETEEETYNKVLMILGYDPELSIQKEFDLAKLYASERLKLSIPSEEEIKVPLWQFKTIKNAIRLAMNALESRTTKDQTAMDRELLRAEQYIKNILTKGKGQ